MTLHSQLKKALQAHQRGQLNQAQTLYYQILKQNPQQAEALHYLGLLQSQNDQYKSGVRLILQSLKLQPKNTSFLNNLGNLYRDQGLYQAALTCFSEIVKLCPNDSEVLNNRALVWLGMEEFEQAEVDLQTAIHLAPKNASLWFNLGRVFSQSSRLDALSEAENCFKKSLDLNPKLAKAWNSLGNLYLDKNRNSDAIVAYEKALIVNPDWTEPLINLASAYAEQSDSGRAIKVLERFLNLHPEHDTARLNYAQLLLLKGNLSQGFAAYEASRWKLDRKIRPLGNLDQPLWQGEPVSSLLLSCEQGFGDSLQFIRFLPQVQERVQEVWLESPPQLKRFFSSISGLKVIEEGEELPAVQAWAPLLRLPSVLDTRLDSIPNQTPYLKAPEQAFPQDFHSLINSVKNKGTLKIGVVWGTGYHQDPTYFKLYQRKSAAPEDFNQLAQDFPQHLFFSLQVGKDALDLSHVHNLTSHIKDFTDTAALIHHLDLIISTDTAVAHLGGALAKPVWLLLPKVADWRWLEDRQDSPWYPEMRLFRQVQAGVWSHVFTELRLALQKGFS